MIVQGPVHGVEEEKLADTVDRLAVVNSILVISAHCSIKPVLVLCLVFPPCESVLELNMIILSIIKLNRTNPADFEEECHDVSFRDDFLVLSATDEE